VGWMEENEESLRGKQSAWHKEAKDQVFADHDEITVKRIKEKAQNMRVAWKEARKLREQSGSGLKPEDNTPSFVALLEKKCAFFWRLDGLWGTRPNAAPIQSANCTQPAAPPCPAADTPSQRAVDPSHQKNPAEREVDEILESASTQAAVAGSDAEPDSEDTPPLQMEATKNTRRGSSVTPSVIGKRKRSKEVERLLGAHAGLELESEERRAKLQRELQREMLEAEERRMELQLESQERIARIIAEAQEKQFKAFMDMMAIVTGTRRTAE